MDEFKAFAEILRLRKENEIMKKILEEHGISVINYNSPTDEEDKD